MPRRAFDGCSTCCLGEIAKILAATEDTNAVQRNNSAQPIPQGTRFFPGPSPVSGDSVIICLGETSKDRRTDAVSRTGLKAIVITVRLTSAAATPLVPVSWCGCYRASP